MKRLRSASFAVVSRLATAIALAGIVDAARPRYGGTLRIETSAALRTRDPATPPVDDADAVARARLLPSVFETLVAPDPAGGVRPALASAWETDPAATRWRFRLRRGVTLHDGTTLEPSDAAAAVRASDPTWTVTSDADAITVHTASPLSNLLWRLTEPERAVVIRRSQGSAVGSGPFAIEQLDAGRRLVLRAHDDHWAGRPFVDRVQIEMGRGSADQLVSLQVGRADLVSVGPQDVRRLAQRALRTSASQPLYLVALMFEPNRPAASGETVRRALALSIDRATMWSVLLQRQGAVAATVLPQWLSGYAPLLATKYDRPLARSLTGSIPADRRVLTLRCDAGDPLMRSIADRIVVDAREAGLAIQLDWAQPPTLRPIDVRLIRLNLDGPTPQRAMNAVARALRPPVRRLLPVNLPDAGDPLEMVFRFEHALLDRHVIVPLVHLPELYGVGARIESWDGPIVLPWGGWDLASVWLRPDKP